MARRRMWLGGSAYQYCVGTLDKGGEGDEDMVVSVHDGRDVGVLQEEEKLVCGVSGTRTKVLHGEV